jgi:hypothetical protein
MDKARHCGLTSSEIDRVKELIQMVSFSFDEVVAENALKELIQMDTEMKRYVESNILPDLGRFSKSKLKFSWTLGHNTTSPAESMNNLLKQDMTIRDHSHEDMRFHCDQKLLDHAENVR